VPAAAPQRRRTCPAWRRRKTWWCAEAWKRGTGGGSWLWQAKGRSALFIMPSVHFLSLSNQATLSIYHLPSPLFITVRHRPSLSSGGGGAALPTMLARARVAGEAKNVKRLLPCL
jgi:hypothetical protein